MHELAERASDLGLTLRDWFAIDQSLAAFQEATRVSLRPGAEAYVRQSILRGEFEQLELDQIALQTSMSEETHLACVLDLRRVQASREADAKAEQLLSNIRTEQAGIRTQLDDLEVDELRLTHLIAATKRRCELVEADRAFIAQSAH